MVAIRKPGEAGLIEYYICTALGVVVGVLCAASAAVSYAATGALNPVAKSRSGRVAMR